MPNLALGELIRAGAVVTGIAQGSSTTPKALGTTAKSAEQLFFSTTATSGSSRVINARLYFNAAGEGEAIRAYGIVNNVTAAVGGTVNGLHATLQVNGASGTISGAANAIRATFAQGASNVAGGTCAVIQLDCDLDTAATVPTTLSYLRCTNSNTKKIDNLLALDGISTTLYAAAGTSSGSAGNSTHCAAQKVLKCLVDGVAVYIPVFTQNS